MDKPLPRFLDDAAATKLMRASRADPDPLSRLIVELLARTGIRKGELLGLTVDAVVQIGSAFWLRIPVGKLHNDRYIPLHPQLKDMLDDWIVNHRPTGLRTDRLLLERNRPLTGLRISNALSRLSQDADTFATSFSHRSTPGPHHYGPSRKSSAALLHPIKRLSNVRFGAGLEAVGPVEPVDIAPYQPPEQIGLFAATTQRGRGQRRDATLDVGALRR